MPLKIPDRIPVKPVSGTTSSSAWEALVSRNDSDLERFETPARHVDRFWTRAEYGFWWLAGGRFPPLITTSPARTPQAAAGVIGIPGTRILANDDLGNDDVRSGGKFSAGFWLDDQRTWGIEGGFFVIGGQGHGLAAGSNGSRIIARPFVDAQLGTEQAQLISFPGLVAGNMTVDAHSDPLTSANLLVRKSLCCDCSRHIDLLVGYRYLGFDEDLRMQENLVSLEPATLGANIVVADHFATRNEFQGGEVGVQAEFARGPFSLELLGKLAIGNLRRQVLIDGSTVVTVPGFAPLVNQGGLLALASNSGTFISDKVVMMPEFGVTAGWQLTSHFRATLGYTFLWLTDIVRPGDQIDRVVNTSLLPPPSLTGLARPVFSLRESDLWVQGLRLGLEFRF